MAAAVHEASSDGEHGHEDGSQLPEPGRHQHGTASDHCTNHHGTALVPSFAFTLFGSECSAARSDPVMRFSVFLKTLVRPPRA